VEGEKWKVEQSGHGMFRRKIHLLDEVADSVSEQSLMPTKTFFLISKSTTDLGFGIRVESFMVKSETE